MFSDLNSDVNLNTVHQGPPPQPAPRKSSNDNITGKKRKERTNTNRKKKSYPQKKKIFDDEDYEFNPSEYVFERDDGQDPRKKRRKSGKGKSKKKNNGLIKFWKKNIIKILEKEARIHPGKGMQVNEIWDKISPIVGKLMAEGKKTSPPNISSYCLNLEREKRIKKKLKHDDPEDQDEERGTNLYWIDPKDVGPETEDEDNNDNEEEEEEEEPRKQTFGTFSIKPEPDDDDDDCIITGVKFPDKTKPPKPKKRKRKKKHSSENNEISYSVAKNRPRRKRRKKKEKPTTQNESIIHLPPPPAVSIPPPPPPPLQKPQQKKKNVNQNRATAPKPPAMKNLLRYPPLRPPLVPSLPSSSLSHSKISQGQVFESEKLFSDLGREVKPPPPPPREKEKPKRYKNSFTGVSFFDCVVRNCKIDGGEFIGGKMKRKRCSPNVEVETVEEAIKKCQFKQCKISDSELSGCKFIYCKGWENCEIV